MQMNHNMGWDGIKDPSLINDKPGWNSFFHNSAIGKLQAPWKHAHMPTHAPRVCVCVWSLWLSSSSTSSNCYVRRLHDRSVELTCHCLHIPLYFRHSAWFDQEDTARLRLWGEGKCCLSSVVLCSAHTDAQTCVNDSLSPRMSAGCRTACYSLQVKCLWRHMEQGKLTTRGNSPEQQEAC